MSNNTTKIIYELDKKNNIHIRKINNLDINFTDNGSNYDETYIIIDDKNTIINNNISYKHQKLFTYAKFFISEYSEIIAMNNYIIEYDYEKILLKIKEINEMNKINKKITLTQLYYDIEKYKQAVLNTKEKIFKDKN